MTVELETVCRVAQYGKLDAVIQLSLQRDKVAVTFLTCHGLFIRGHDEWLVGAIDGLELDEILALLVFGQQIVTNVLPAAILYLVTLASEDFGDHVLALSPARNRNRVF
ncbi:hypothetical protein O4H53_22355 [Sulfitobacter sp. G21635-S1]|nr:hypothetical protein [Sulfitobacter sp. G21635-S1]